MKTILTQLTPLYALYSKRWDFGQIQAMFEWPNDFPYDEKQLVIFEVLAWDIAYCYPHLRSEQGLIPHASQKEKLRDLIFHGYFNPEELKEKKISVLAYTNWYFEHRMRIINTMIQDGEMSGVIREEIEDFVNHRK